MNIAIFTPSQNPYSETFIQAHKNHLKGKVFYYYGNGAYIQLEGHTRLMPLYRYKFLRVYAKVFRKPSSYLWQKRVLYNLKANNIEAVLVEYGTHAYHLKDLLKSSGLPVAVHFHGYDASIGAVIQKCGNYKAVFAIAKKVIVVSKVMEQKVLELGCPKAKLVYNVYGPNPDFVKVVPKFTKKQFVAIGRFTDKKAPYYTIMAFKQVLEKHPDAHLLMAGDGELLNMCKNLVKQYNITEQVHFLGVVTPEQYQVLLAESLAFVQHSITADTGDMEGTPLSVLEASAAGLPVISTIHAGIPDVIVHGETGLICDEHDVEGMSKHMMMLFDDFGLAKSMGAKGKQHIVEHFSLQRHIETLQEILSS